MNCLHPAHPVSVEAPFQQWEMDFLGEIPEKSSNGLPEQVKMQGIRPDLSSLRSGIRGGNNSLGLDHISVYRSREKRSRVPIAWRIKDRKHWLIMQFCGCNSDCSSISNDKWAHGVKDQGTRVLGSWRVLGLCSRACISISCPFIPSRLTKPTCMMPLLWIMADGWKKCLESPESQNFMSYGIDDCEKWLESP
jgi:hypothetical protein